MYQALRSVSQTLQEFIAARIAADAFLSAAAAPFTARGMTVSIQTPQEMTDAGREGVAVWLYRVVRDEQLLNEPPRRLTPFAFAARPLPLRLHYLVVPI